MELILLGTIFLFVKVQFNNYMCINFDLLVITFSCRQSHSKIYPILFQFQSKTVESGLLIVIKDIRTCGISPTSIRIGSYMVIFM